MTYKLRQSKHRKPTATVEPHHVPLCPSIATAVIGARILHAWLKMPPILVFNAASLLSLYILKLDDLLDAPSTKLFYFSINLAVSTARSGN